MNTCEWRPNWKDEEAYKWILDAHQEHIAWEFLRRNPAYAQDCLKYPQDTAARAFAPYAPEAPTPEPLALNYGDVCRKYGVKEMYPPSTEGRHVEFSSILPWDCLNREGLPEEFHPPGGVYHDADGNPTCYADSSVDLSGERDVVVKFSAGKNIRPQLAAAESLLKSLARAFDEIYGAQKSKRTETDNTVYIRHLRALDAMDAGERPYQIGLQLSSKGDNTPAGEKEPAPWTTRGKEYVEQAIAYRDSKYRLLVGTK